MLDEVSREGVDGWKDWMNDAALTVDAFCPQASALAALAASDGLTADEEAELVVMMLVSRFVRRKERPVQSTTGVWSCGWNELVHGACFVLKGGSFQDVLKGVVERLLEKAADRRFSPLLESCLLYCQQFPAWDSYPVADELFPFMLTLVAVDYE